MGRGSPERLEEVLAHSDTDDPQAGLRDLRQLQPRAGDGRHVQTVHSQSPAQRGSGEDELPRSEEIECEILAAETKEAAETHNFKRERQPADPGEHWNQNGVIPIW